MGMRLGLMSQLALKPSELDGIFTAQSSCTRPQHVAEKTERSFFTFRLLRISLYNGVCSIRVNSCSYPFPSLCLHPHTNLCPCPSPHPYPRPHLSLAVYPPVQYVSEQFYCALYTLAHPKPCWCDSEDQQLQMEY